MNSIETFAILVYFPTTETETQFWLFLQMEHHALPAKMAQGGKNEKKKPLLAKSEDHR